MKKLVCITIAISMMLYTYTIAYADTNDYIPEWLSFTVDSANTIMRYNGSDVAFNSYLQGTAQAAAYGGMVQALNRIDNDDYGNLPRIPMNAVFNGMLDPTIGYLDGQYRACLVNRDYVDNIYSMAGGYGQNDRYRSLEYYGVTIEGDYTLDGIEFVGSRFISDSINTTLGYLDFSGAYDGKTHIVSTPYTPPILYTGSTSTTSVFHHGVRLNGGEVYFLIDNDMLMKSKTSLYMSGTTYYLASNLNRYGSGVGNIKLYLNSCKTVSYDTNTGYYSLSNRTSIGNNLVRVYNGVAENYSDSNSYAVIDMFEKQIGVEATIEQHEISPPSDIPYDSNDCVIMLNPDYSVNDYEYKTVKYMSPQTFNDYVTEGDVTYNTYTYNDDNSVVNNVINNYYNYVDNGSSGGGSFDDSRIVGRLDTIIGKLTDIIDSIKNIGTSDVPGVKIFSSTPIYTDFGDCITNNVGLANDIERINDSIDVTQSERVDGYIDRFKGEYIYTDEPYDGLFDDITVNTDWYEPYRVKVRNILKIPCWIFAIFGSWAVVKSVFGVKE